MDGIAKLLWIDSCRPLTVTKVLLKSWLEYLPDHIFQFVGYALRTELNK